MATDTAVSHINQTLVKILAELTKLREAAERIAASHSAKR